MHFRTALGAWALGLTLSSAAFARPSPPAAPAPEPIVPLTIVHPTSYDVRVHVEADGTATAEHTIGVRVSGGALHALELKAHEQGSIPAADPVVTSEDGRAVAATMAVREGGDIRVEAVDAKGWKRGAYTVRFALKSDLAQTGALRRDGVLYRIAWSSPMLGEGVDGMRVVFDLPAAPTEPRADGDQGLLSTLRRSASRDEVEIVRPHVGRGEAATWEVRVDPRALPAVKSPGLATRPLAPPTAPEDAPRSSSPIALGASASLLVLLLALAKEKSLETSGPEAPASIPVLPLPRSARFALASVSAGGSVLAFVDGSLVLGGAAIVLACVALARRAKPSAARRRAKARGPGEWLALRPEEAFARPSPSALGLSSWRGRAAFVAALGAMGLLAWAAEIVDPRVPPAVAALAAILPTLWTAEGRSGLVITRGLLARAQKKLAKVEALRVVPWARVQKGGSRIEELRLRVLPRHPIPGLAALELGTAGEAFEVLVRVRDDSPAARRLGACAKLTGEGGASLRPLPGRTPDERVLALEPASPSLRAACRLAEELGALLIDRREAEPAAEKAPPRAYEGPERRTLVEVAAA